MHAGTAGLRALDGPGFNRMNTITVKQTTQGLVRYLQQQQTTGWDLRCGEGSPNLLSGTEYLKKGIIVGYDGRTNSRECAPATCASFWCHLLECVSSNSSYLFPHQCFMELKQTFLECAHRMTFPTCLTFHC